MSATTATPAASPMDRPREGRAKRRVWPIVAIALPILLAAVWMATLRRSAPQVERASLVIDTVTRGPLLRGIAAAGTLVAEQSRLIVAPTAGRVDRVHVETGQEVRAGDAIATLVNRETIKELLQIEQELSAAEADLADLTATLQARSLESEKTTRRTEFESRDASRRAEAAAQLLREGLISGLEATRATEASQEAAERVGSERQRHAALERSARAQLDAQRNRIGRQRALHAFQKSIVESLVVRTPAHGAIREKLVQEGEWLVEGQRLVRLVEAGRLEAVLQVPEGAALEVRPGQRVAMNARGAALGGVVERVAPAVEQGTVAVEVRLEGAVPPGLRPDLSVEGRIEIGLEKDVLTVARPANATPGGQGLLYALEAGHRRARRIDVRYGPASVDRIVIARGAAAGDRLVVAGLDAASDPVVRLK